MVRNFDGIAGVHVDDCRFGGMLQIVTTAADGFIVVDPVCGVVEDAGVVVCIVQSLLLERRSFIADGVSDKLIEGCEVSTECLQDLRELPIFRYGIDGQTYLFGEIS